jgi:hypothetical protein
MNTLKNIWKLAFSLVFLLGVMATATFFQIRYYVPAENIVHQNLVYIEVETEDLEFVTNEPLYFSQEEMFETSGMLFFESNAIHNFIFMDNISKSQLILSHILLTLICLLIATKFHIDTNIYEFFHKNADNEVVFESEAYQITHYLTTYTGMIFKAVGISCAFLAIFAYVF